MRQKLLQALEKNATLARQIEILRGLVLQDGGSLQVTFDYRTEPYLDHTVSNWVDGPPSSNVVAVLSGADPEGGRWRRFTISLAGPGHVEIDVSPTPFRNADHPLSPGIPPGASR